MRAGNAVLSDSTANNGYSSRVYKLRLEFDKRGGGRFFDQIKSFYIKRFGSRDFEELDLHLVKRELLVIGHTPYKDRLEGIVALIRGKDPNALKHHEIT